MGDTHSDTDFSSLVRKDKATCIHTCNLGITDTEGKYMDFAESGTRINVRYNLSGTATTITAIGCTNLQVGCNNTMIVNHEHASNSTQSTIERNRRPESELTNCRDKPTYQDLQFVCQHVRDQWKMLGNKLDLSEPELDQIEYDYQREGIQEIIWQLLQKWKKKGQNVTVQKLALALYKVNLFEEAFTLPVKNK